MLVGTLFSLSIYLAASLIRGGGLDDPWLAPALFNNGSFALIFSGAGAALGQAYAAAKRR